MEQIVTDRLIEGFGAFLALVALHGVATGRLRDICQVRKEK